LRNTITGRAFVYGGMNVKAQALATVEMRSVDGREWHKLPTDMFDADATIASVPLSIKLLKSFLKKCVCIMLNTELIYSYFARERKFRRMFCVEVTL